MPVLGDMPSQSFTVEGCITKVASLFEHLI